MADRVEWFDITVPAGTLKSAPLKVNTSFPEGIVTSVEITVPAGHAGLTGIAIAQAGQQVIPRTFGAFIIANDRVIPWELHNYLDNGSWSVICYNTDVYSHMFHLAFLVNEGGPVGPGSPGFIQPALVIGPAPSAELFAQEAEEFSYPTFEG